MRSSDSGGMPGPSSCHENFNLVRLVLAPTHRDRAIRAAVFDGVVHEIGEDLFEPVRVRQRGEFGQFVDEFHALGVGARFEVGQNFFGERTQRDGLQTQFDPSGFQRGNGEQILNEQVEPAGVAFDDFEKTFGDDRGRCARRRAAFRRNL